MLATISTSSSRSCNWRLAILLGRSLVNSASPPNTLVDEPADEAEKMLSLLPTDPATLLPSLPGGAVTRISSSMHCFCRSKRLVQMRWALLLSEENLTGGLSQKGSMETACRSADAIDLKSGVTDPWDAEFCEQNKAAVKVARTVVSDAKIFVVEHAITVKFCVYGFTDYLLGHPTVVNHSASSPMRHVNQTKPSRASPRKASSRSSGLAEHTAVADTSRARW
jgi:hypothetical protein